LDEQSTITDVAISEITETTTKCTFTITSAEKVQKVGLMYDTNYSLSEEYLEFSTTVIGWISSVRGVGVSYRGFISPDLSHNYLGFRLAFSSK